MQELCSSFNNEMDAIDNDWTEVFLYDGITYIYIK